MFGFGPMSSFYDEDFEDDGYDPTEPFSQDEFVSYSNNELAALDAGRDSDALCRVRCPDCGAIVVFDEDDDEVECQDCGCEFDVD